MLVTQLQLYLQLGLFLVMLAPAVLHYNARSVSPKVDELCVVPEVNSPNIICIMESRLCKDVSDSDIALDASSTGQKQTHARATFTSNTLPSHNNLETLTLTVHNRATKVCISLLYLSPLLQF